MLHTTLMLVRKCKCFKELHKNIVGVVGAECGENTPIPINTVLDYEHRGLNLVVGCLVYSVLPDERKEANKICWHFAADCFERLRLFEDDKSIKAISIMRKYSVGEATVEDIFDAWEDAHDSADPFPEPFGLDWAFCMIFLITGAISSKSIDAYNAEVKWQKEQLRGYLEGSSNPLRQRPQ